MNQITDSITSQLNELKLIPTNQNMNLLNQPTIPSSIANQQNIPLNQNISIGLQQQAVNNPQNEDTSKFFFNLNINLLL